MDRPESGARDCDGSDIVATDSAAAFIVSLQLMPTSVSSFKTDFLIHRRQLVLLCSATDSSDAVARSRNAVSKLANPRTREHCLPYGGGRMKETGLGVV